MNFDNKGAGASDDRALAELARLNRQSLELLRSQAASPSGVAQAQPIIAELADLWPRLTPAAIQRASACPCLLVDFGFFDARRWTAVAHDLVLDQERTARFFDIPEADSVARAILTEVWHYSRMRGALLGLFGISSSMAAILASCSQTQILLVAESNGGWLMPRWPARVWFWRNLLTAALADDHTALTRVGMQGVAMLATDMRRGARTHPPLT